MNSMFNAKMGLKGHFVIDVVHRDGTKDRYESDNLIVDQGLDDIGSRTSGYVTYGVAVGTDNTPPVSTDTALGNGIAASHNLTSSRVTVVSTTAPYVIQNEYVFTFSVGAVVGNVTELGCITNGQGAEGKIFSRALIEVDGSPGAIELLSTDQLIVTYQLQSIMTSDITGTLNIEIDGVPETREYTIKPIGFGTNSQSSYHGQKSGIKNSNGGSFNGWYTGPGEESSLKSVTSKPYSKGTGWYGENVVEDEYVDGSFEKTITYSIGTGNAMALQSSTWATNWFSFQMILDSPIPLIDDQTLSWPITISWADASGA